MMKTVLRQPILHFLLLAGVLFAIFEWENRGEEQQQRIVIDDAALLDHLQYRARAFNPENAQARLRSMDPQQLDLLIRQLVREEALHREALALNLDEDDYVIKQRLIQKVEYLSRGFSEPVGEVDREMVERFYAGNSERYYREPTATFTHVFLRNEGNSEDREQAATRLLETLNRGRGQFSPATGYGDRFPYHTHYVERTENLIASHFGDDFAARLLRLEADEGRWQGPLASEHGRHLVLVRKIDDGGQPPLESIYETVAEDTRRWLTDSKADEALDRLVDRYDVELVHTYGTGAEAGPSPVADNRVQP